MSDKTSTVDLAPLSNQIILSPSAPVAQIGVIIVPEAHQRSLNQGTVIEKGPLVTSAIEVGDVVFFSMHSEARLNYGGQSYIIVPEESCLGRVRKNTPPTPAPAE